MAKAKAASPANLPDSFWVQKVSHSVYLSTIEVTYIAALKKADVDALVVGLKEIDQLQDRLDQFNHDHKIEVDGRILELAS